MKRRGFLMGLLTVPVAGLAVKEIIEKATTPSNAFVVNCDECDNVISVTRTQPVRIMGESDFRTHRHEDIAAVTKQINGGLHNRSDLEGYDEMLKHMERIRYEMIWNSDTQLIERWHARGSA